MSESLLALIGRHGTTVLNQKNCFRSWSDPCLAEEGIQQAKKMDKFLRQFQIKQIMCSPLLRAVQTAGFVAEGQKIGSVYQDRGLFPWRLGIFQGLDKDDNNDALRLFVQNPLVTIPGGESLEDFEGRQFEFWAPALEMVKATGLTLFVAHTSNVTSLVNFTEGAHEIEPEFGDSVKPGGVGAIYFDPAKPKGEQYRVEPIFGGEEEAVFGGS